jgi:hypothetical protein
MPTKQINSKLRNFAFCLVILTFEFCLLNLSYAAPCYGTKLPEKRQAVAGLQNYNIFKRYLGHGYGKMRSTQEFLLLSYGIFDWLSIDLKGGAGWIKEKSPGQDQLNYPSYLAGGYGFRIRFWHKNNFKAVFGFQHVSAHPKSISVNGIKHKAVLDDWQLSLLASYEFKRITPYLGARVSRCDYIHWKDGSRNRVKSDGKKWVGLILGLDLPLTKKCWLNLEGSFLDADSAAVSINYGF